MNHLTSIVAIALGFGVMTAAEPVTAATRLACAKIHHQACERTTPVTRAHHRGGAEFVSSTSSGQSTPA